MTEEAGPVVQLSNTHHRVNARSNMTIYDPEDESYHPVEMLPEQGIRNLTLDRTTREKAFRDDRVRQSEHNRAVGQTVTAPWSSYPSPQAWLEEQTRLEEINRSVAGHPYTAEDAFWDHHLEQIEA